MKIVIIGAGSGSFGGGMIRDVLVCPELRGRDVTLSLVDIDPEALERMAGFAEMLKQQARMRPSKRLPTAGPLSPTPTM